MFGFNARVIKVTAIVALGLMIAAVSAAAATAAPGDPPVGGYRLETSNSVSCGSVAITLRNVSPWVFGVSVLVDGAKYNGSDYNLTVNNLVSSNPFVPGPMDSDASRTLTITFPEDSGTHTVSYKVTYGSENTLYKNLPVGTATEVTVQSDCLPPVPVCPTPDNASGTYDVHLGQTLADRNSPATFGINSYGGLIGAVDPSHTFAEIQALGTAWNNTYIRSNEGEYTVTYYFAEKTVTGHFVPGSGAVCDSLTWAVSDLIAVTAVAPSVVEPAKCMPNNDVLNIPIADGMTYSDTGWINNSRTITANPALGFTLTGQTSWTFLDTPSAGCPAVGPGFSGEQGTSGAGELANTGPISQSNGLLALAILLVAAGSGLLVRHSQADSHAG